MAAFDSSLLGYYLFAVLALAAVSVAFALGVAVTGVARNRRIRLARHQSMRTYYGRLALRH